LLSSVCLYCGSSDAADPDFLQAAREFGQALAAEKIRLVYGGGGIGLMGAAARGCHDAGGKVLGVMPEFLRTRELLYDDVETVVVPNMHQRKIMLFDESDAFVVMPGGIGTLEEIVELLSWRRLDLHRKPIAFFNLKNYWDPFFALMRHTVDQKLTPAWVPDVWHVVDRVDAILPALRSPAKAGL
jgi:uncharacterized protein (TIGR00730 family)